MAESPAYRSIPARIVCAVIEQHHKGTEEGRCGYTLATSIVLALTDAGFIEPQPTLEHNHFTRDIRPDSCPACEATATGQAIKEYEKRASET